MATAQQPPVQAEFVKAISRLDATALVVGSMIGSGIFIVSAEILREVGTPGLLLVVWALSGVVTLMGALTYGELAAMFPNAGGQYVYLREGISPLFGYLYGWTLFVVIQTGTIAAVAVAFARFTSVLLPSLSPDLWPGLGTVVMLPQPIGTIQVGLSPQRVFAILSIVVLTWINVRGVRTAAIIQTSLTAIKTAALAGLIVLGISIGRNATALAANFGPGFWPAGGLSLALLPVIGAATVGSLFSMDAWNNVGFAGSELSGARVYYAMARDNLFFETAGILHPRYKTPTVALVVQAVWTCVLCLSGTYSQLLNFVIFAALLFYTLTAIGLFALRAKRPTAERLVKSLGYPWLPGLYVVATALIAVDLLVNHVTRTYSLLGLALVLLGVPVYIIWRRLVP